MDANHYLRFLIFLTLLSIMSIVTEACDNQQNTTSTYSTQPSYKNATQTYKSYIKTSCNAATYSSICYKSLNPYALQIQAEPLKLCNTSLSLALKAARSASSTISKILKTNNLTKTAEEVLHDCFDNIKESVGEIQDSLVTMEYLNKSSDKRFAMSNIKTWVSAAITDDTTCSDEFDGENVDGSMRDQIKTIVLNVARMTSNALFFINHLTY